MHFTIMLPILSSLAATALSQEFIWGDTAACESIVGPSQRCDHSRMRG